MKKFKFTINGKEYDVNVENIAGENATVVVDGVKYDVAIKREEEPVAARPVAPKAKVNTTPKAETAAQPKSSAPAGGFKAQAPLPGTIMKIFVNVGDQVKRGDKMLVYEAMKMENNFLAEIDGTVKEICVREGDNVLQGANLFIIG